MILAVIQARMSSQRLPGKVLMEINGRPMLQWVIEAAQAAKMVDRVVVATSAEKISEAINELCENIKIDLCIGSRDDVLDRFYQTALYCNPSHIVRLTGDCPAMDPLIIDMTVRHHLEGGYDYTSNRPAYPSGLDVEVFSMDTLVRAAKLATSREHREHVTLFMQDRALFRVGRLMDYDGPDGKFSVDTQDEFDACNEMMKTLNTRGNF